MLRSRKKLILIGLLGLGFLSLVYTFLNSRPEMIADNSLRVPEEARPEFDRVMNISPTVRVNEPAAPDVIESARRLSGAGISQGGEALIGAMQDSLTTDSELALSAEAASEAVTVAQGDAEAEIVVGEQVVEQQAVEQFADSDESGISSEVVESVSGEASTIASAEVVKSEPANDALSEPSDVILIADQEGFVDLNLAETQPLEFELIEGDDIIIDDVNEVLVKLNPARETEQLPESEIVIAEAEQLASTEMPQDLIAGKGGISEQDMRESGEYVESDLMQLPEPDPELMNGRDAISLEYQASYKKLEDVIGRLQVADEENAVLKGRFDEIADENRQLAQIIRDIDVKIKELSSDN